MQQAGWLVWTCGNHFGRFPTETEIMLPTILHNYYEVFLLTGSRPIHGALATMEEELLAHENSEPGRLVFIL